MIGMQMLKEYQMMLGVKLVYHARIAGRQTNRANSVIQGGTTEDYYRMNVAVPFIDHLLQELLTRFEQENRVYSSPCSNYK